MISYLPNSLWKRSRAVRYHSTRSKEHYYEPSEAILKGLCDDGGLFVADGLEAEKLDLSHICHMDYMDEAYEVMRHFLTDMSEEELKGAIGRAYEGRFSSRLVTPLTELGRDWLLELYHGPTSAFKDVALCMLPQLMSIALRGRDERLMIVTATSGDTGKAALEGFRDAEHIGITVFYPDHKVSDIQYLQMATQEGSNTFVGAVRGNFDDCQTEVKRIFSSDIAGRLAERNIWLSSANSINIGRLIPQIVYYVDAWRQLFMKGEIGPEDAVDFCVPTGNFGDVLAGYLAKLMGLPVGRLIVASNENKVLTDFLTTGVYDRRRDFVKTISPSMDILVSSNLERLLYYESGGDCELVAGLMKDLSEKGVFRISDELLSGIRESFECGFATDEEAKAYIKQAYEDFDRILDPHTAVAYKVASDYISSHGRLRPMIVLSTASPYKFASDVLSSLTGEEKSGFEAMDRLYELTREPVPSALAGLRDKRILHDRVLDREQMKDFVYENAGRMKS